MNILVICVLCIVYCVLCSFFWDFFQVQKKKVFKHLFLNLMCILHNKRCLRNIFTLFYIFQFIDVLHQASRILHTKKKGVCPPFFHLWMCVVCVILFNILGMYDTPFIPKEKAFVQRFYIFLLLHASLFGMYMHLHTHKKDVCATFLNYFVLCISTYRFVAS